MNTILVMCCNDGCGHKFRVPEFSRPNSTIKTNPDKQECQQCKNMKAFSGYKKKKKKSRPKSRVKPRKKTWKDKPLGSLLRHVQYLIVNPYIRARDNACFGGECISCTGRLTSAGHRYSVGEFAAMRLFIENLHGQCFYCNNELNGNGSGYDEGLLSRHDYGAPERLKRKAEECIANTNHKWNRFEIIEIAEVYQYMTDNRIWVFTEKEFDEVRGSM